jgi:hypothetical protein
MGVSTSRILATLLKLSVIFIGLILVATTYFYLKARINPQSVSVNQGDASKNFLATSLVDTHSFEINDLNRLTELANTRLLFEEGVILPNESNRVLINNVTLLFTSQEQDQLITYWPINGENVVGVASGYDVTEGNLNIRLFIRDAANYEEKQLVNILNYQLAKTIYHLTRAENKNDRLEEMSVQSLNDQIDSDRYILEVKKIK